MCKRLFLLATLLMFAAPAFAPPVGIFDYTADVGHDWDALDPLAIGFTNYIYQDTYVITAGGSDIWADHDHFHYAYNQVSGDVRIEAKLRWQDSGWNDWAKMGVMLREDLSRGSIHYSTDHRKGGGDPWSKLNTTGENSVFGQWRSNTNAGSGGHDWWNAFPDKADDVKIGVQRVNWGGMEFVQHLLDKGAGWEAFRTHWGANLMADDILAGVCVTSHDNAWAVQAKASEVAYTENPDLLGFIGNIPAGTEKCDCTGLESGFAIYTASPDDATEPWNWLSYENLYVIFDGLVPLDAEGTRLEQFVNLYDSDGRGEFANDQSFPGIDPFEQEAQNPAAGDNDDYFVTEITGCIELTAGEHIFGVNSDDGALVEIGGILVSNIPEWKGASTVPVLFTVEEAGLYSLRIRHLEGGGGASLEFLEWVNGAWVLANDTANGASPVCVPEPATIALLGFGGLAMLRIRKRS